MAGLHTVEFASGGDLAKNETSQVYMLATESDIIRGIFHYLLGHGIFTKCYVGILAAWKGTPFFPFVISIFQITVCEGGNKLY